MQPTLNLASFTQAARTGGHSYAEPDSAETTLASPHRESGALAYIMAMLAGFALRAVFITCFPGMDDDSLAYGSIAKNLLAHHAYAIGDPPQATLIRLPGYPFFLALVFRCFGIDNYTAVRWVQVLIDLGGCLLLSAFVRENVSRRAGWIALWIAVLCPFTANYAAIPMAETLSVFCVSLCLLATSRLIRSLRRDDGRLLWHILLTALALCGAILLRPDGVLLAAAVIPGIIYYARGRDTHDVLSTVAYIVLLIVAVLTPWTTRNYIRFHVFQPLAPRYANNPDELVPYGVLAWNKTWEVDYVSSPEVFWTIGASAVDIQDLPPRAFDSADQYAKTSRLIMDYNATCDSHGENCQITHELDGRFAALAAERYRQRPFRSRLLLPAARVMDMWLRPRTAYLPVPLHWWEWRAHPGATLFAAGYAGLNCFLLVLAGAGLMRRRVPLAFIAILYIVFRCLLLATMSNAEPRYTLECYPMVLAAAAIFISRLEERHEMADAAPEVAFEPRYS